MRELRSKTPAGQRQLDKKAVDARAIKCSDDDFKETNLHVVRQLFKEKEERVPKSVVNFIVTSITINVDIFIHLGLSQREPS